MPSFFGRFFDKKEKKDKKDKDEKDGKVEEEKHAEAPATPADAAHPPAMASTPRSASVQSTSPPPPITTNSSFARDDSSNSHLGAGAGGVMKMPPGRGGVKILVPPPKMGGPHPGFSMPGAPPMFFPPQGPHGFHPPPGMMQMPQSHHQHHHYNQFAPPPHFAMMQAQGGQQVAQPSVADAPQSTAPQPVVTQSQPAPATPTSAGIAPAAAPAPVVAHDTSMQDIPPPSAPAAVETQHTLPAQPVQPAVDTPANVVAPQRVESVDVSDSDSDDIQFAEEESLSDGAHMLTTQTTGEFVDAKAGTAGIPPAPLAPLMQKKLVVELQDDTPPLSVVQQTQFVTAVAPQAQALPVELLTVATDAQRAPPTSKPVADETAKESITPTQNPSPVARQKMADLFLSILCPQQYYGKVTRVRDVRVFDNGNQSDAFKSNKCQKIIVATKRSVASTTAGDKLFYPLVRFGPEDMSNAQGEQKTPIMLYEVFPGQMTFAEDEAAAISSMKVFGAQSCYVVSKSAIVFPVDATVCPLASMNVCWIPFSQEQANGTCPIHNVPFELFDKNSRELVCALCLTKVPFNDRRDVAILSEMMSESQSRQMFHSLNAKATEASRHLHRLMHHHTKALRSCQSQRQAIDQQFELLIAAIQAKRDELREQATDELSAFASSIAKEILSVDEQVQIMKAAADHLYKSASLKPLQMGTVAHAVAVADKIAYNTNGQGQHAPMLPPPIHVNLESILSQIQTLAPTSSRDITVHTPIRTAPRTPKTISSPVSKQSPTRAAAPGTMIAATPGISSPRGERCEIVPGPDGTSIYSTSIHEMLSITGAVTWTLTIHDSGDWIGVGVGVGPASSGWNCNTIPRDLSHLWIVPPRAPRTLTLRVIISGGNAKLSIFDKRGKQLDDGRIGHWNASRACFPQVTFGGRFGKATMSRAPEPLQFS